MEIVFAVGVENKVAILHHSEGNYWNSAEIDLLYEEIEKGCPTIQRKALSEGIYRGEFSTEGIHDLWIIKRRWEREFACA